MEIIEVGAVAVENATGTIISEFQAFVRPVREPKLTEFCKSLTKISQDDVDGAEFYGVMLRDFTAWLAQLGSYDFCSWGENDRHQFELDSAYHKVAYPFSGPHRNIKKEFSEAIGSPKRFGLGQAVRRIGLQFEGTAHRGIDDARNIAAVYQQAILLGSQRV